MANRDLNIRLNADATGFERGFKSAEASAAAFEREIKKVEDAQRAMAGVEAQAYREQAMIDKKRSDSLAKVGRAMQLVGLAGVAAGAVAVKSFADFDSAMSEVQAATHESAGNMELLRKASLKAGKETSYSATEAAGAVGELAKAGVSTADILGGGLSGALNLAAAGGIDVGEAAETAASAMTQFGLGGKDVGHIADLLAAGAGKAQGSVSDLGAALGQSGLVASQMGISIEQSTGTLAAFASAGLTGSDAGTSFKTMLLSLANPSAQASETMKQLGISAYDAQGQFVGTEKLAGQLKGALGGLSQEQRDSALATIFGSDAIRAANVLYTQGAAGIGTWTAAVDDTGFAAETASTRMDNLSGDLERLKGSLETAFISGGEGASSVLRTLVQLATQAVDSFTELPPELQSAAAGAAIVGGGLVAMGGAALEAGQKIVEVKETMEALGLTAGNLKTAFGKVTTFLGGPWGLAIAAAVTLLAAFGASAYEAHKRQEELKSTLDATTGAITDQTKALVAQNLQQDGTLRLARSLGINLQTVTDAALGNADAVASLRSAYDAAVSANGKFIAQNGIAAGAQNALDVQTNKTSASLQNQVTGLGTLIDVTGESAGVISGQAAAAAEVADAAGTAAASTGDMTEAANVAAAAASNLSDAEVQLRADLSETAGSFVSVGTAFKDAQDDVDAAAKESAQKQADVTKSTKDSWEDYAKSVTASFDQVVAKLEEQVTAQGEWERNMILLAGRVSDGTLDNLRKMGPEGAALVADLTKRSQAELDKFDQLSQASLSSTTDGWADRLREASPLLANVARDLGEATAQGYRERLADGTISIEQVMDEYAAAVKAKVPPIITTKLAVLERAKAVGEVDALGNAIRGLPTSKTITLAALVKGSLVSTAPAAKLKPGDPGYGVRVASGGPISGPGTGTSDSIPAWLSDGEYVIKASQTAKHRGLLDAINSGREGYATGGLVGGPKTSTILTQLPSVASINAGMGTVLAPLAKTLQANADKEALANVMSQTVASTGAGVQRWAGVVLQALQMVGQPASLLATVLRRMNQESGGNPNAINLWDSNAKAGHPSEGLMQTIPSTFRANHFPGTSNNIRDPLANILASMVYAMRRYGSLSAAYNKKGGYAAGGPVVGPGGPTDDKIPAFLSNGEFVVNAAAAKANAGLLQTMNARKYATGGLVQRSTTSGNGFDLAGYLARSTAPAAPARVDDSALRAANLELVAWSSRAALAENALAAAKERDSLASDQLSDANSKLESAQRDVESSTTAVKTAQDRLAKLKKDADADTRADAVADVNDALADQRTATDALRKATDAQSVASKVATSSSQKLTQATEDEASISDTLTAVKTRQAAAEDALNDAKATALAYSQKIAQQALSGAETTSLFSQDDVDRTLAYAQAAYAASLAQGQAATDATTYQDKIDQLAESGAKLAAAQAATGASYATQKATLAGTRAEVEKLATSYGFTAAQARALAESAVPLANTGDTLVASLERQLTSVTNFSKSVSTLRALGLSQGLIDQILEAGPAKGEAMAEELISGGSQMVKRLNDLQAQLVKASTDLGNAAANAAYGPAPVVVAPVARTIAQRGVVLKAGGGYVSGPGTATSDSIPAYLSDGEFVVKAAAVARYGTSFLDGVNAMKFASGGLVARAMPSAGRLQQPIVVQSAPSHSGPQFNAPIFSVDTVRETVDVDMLWQRAPLALGPLGLGGGR